MLKLAAGLVTYAFLGTSAVLIIVWVVGWLIR